MYRVLARLRAERIYEQPLTKFWLSQFRRERLPYEAAFLTDKAFLQYRRRGGVRVKPLPDSYIGAHAAVAGFRLLTRDPKRYRAYFPSVELIVRDQDNAMDSC
jgi:predicted nucleic acid-binding protein